MCGILAITGLSPGFDAASYRRTALMMARRLRHRGPDWSGVYADSHAILLHERLTIVDVTTGAQPQYSPDGNVVLAVNGEIYNHLDIREEMRGKATFKSNSDCEVIIHMYQQSGGKTDFVNDLRGMFAFVLYDRASCRIVAARDPVGIVPLYIGWAADGSVWFASELKALCDSCTRFMQFPPGHLYDSSLPMPDRMQLWYQPAWRSPSFVPDPIEDLDTALHNALVDAVKSHLMADVPFGVLLSGGLDSSLIASIANRLVSSDGEGRIRSFSIGLEGSPDLAAARSVAEFLGTRHHEFTFTVQEGLDALTPMFLLARRIKATGVKMVLSGEGSDEVFGGYLYFHKAPNAEDFQAELIDKIADLHKYDCLRANKAMSAFGVEVRVPFLDTRFLDMAMSIDARAKMARDEVTGAKRMEKYVLRRAFSKGRYLPDDILWRQKEQFSDGVGYGWIDSLKEFAENHVSDAMMETAEYRFLDKTPTTKEAYLYRQIFESHFPQQAARDTVPWAATIACSTPRAFLWDKAFQAMADPSGRCVVGVHDDAYRHGGSI
ncbi:unnamed protein product (mitochondrion) [Plasmodiophora brassicae]|uniref:asparagine synthase (glutamine-hydrolyzing) n=1 Tax=Plasmodiophora brassicae TaxID=37360 RepID=A0A3P3YJI9_PLABS|nr:unnamed protein product [Plasmodiophora brassicae]